MARSVPGPWETGLWVQQLHGLRSIPPEAQVWLAEAAALPLAVVTPRCGVVHGGLAGADRGRDDAGVRSAPQGLCPRQAPWGHAYSSCSSWAAV